MQKMYKAILFFNLVLLLSCGTPNDPESLIGDDGGYKIVSKFATSGYAQDIVVKDSLAYIAQGQSGLIILSVSNPKEPKFISELTYGLRGYSYKLAKKDSAIYLAAGTFGVNTVNVANPLNPLITKEDRPIAPAKNFHIMSDYIFTAVSEEGINISNIKDPLYPSSRQTFFIPGYAQAICTSAADTSAENNYLLAACGEVGFTIFDISDFQDGYNIYSVVGWLDTPGYAEDVTIHSDLPVAFLACGTGGLVIADYSDTANVKIIGSYSTGGYAKEVVYKNNKAFVTTGMRGLQIFDVTNLTSPVRIGTVETELAMSLAVDDKYVYVADESEGLIIISIP
ncbi:MAG: hypothetical protein MUE91_00885 [Ignavibacteriaceae bacterium]|jgi:hypothetical protein|nr:hypothetical protein [Ignavibacteriaceae bacterium]